MLLDELKNYLDITWDDTANDSKLEGILNRAESIISAYAGITLDFEDAYDKQLLFDCCRYIRCNALEDFKTNFSAELIMIRAKYATAEPDPEPEGDNNGE